jgi:hypothetical protein
MFGPVQLTHLIYIVIPIIFICVIGYMIYYTRKVGARQKELSRNGAVSDTPSSIAAATESLERDDK